MRRAFLNNDDIYFFFIITRYFIHSKISDKNMMMFEILMGLLDLFFSLAKYLIFTPGLVLSPAHHREDPEL